MFVVAIASLAATVAIPLMTKAVIDGPVRHQDQRGLWLLGAAAIAVGVSEAILWFIRRWLVARATMGVEADIRKDLYARLQILPMSFHGRWQSGQLLSRIMNDLSTIRRFTSFGLIFLVLNVLADHHCDGDPAGAVLAAGCGGSGIDRADHLDSAALSARVTSLCRGWHRTSPGTSPPTSKRPRWVCGWSKPSAARTTCTGVSTNNSLICTPHEVKRVSVSAKFWTLLEVIPNVTLIVVLGFGAYAAGHGRSRWARWSRSSP